MQMAYYLTSITDRQMAYYLTSITDRQVLSTYYVI